MARSKRVAKSSTPLMLALTASWNGNMAPPRSRLASFAASAVEDRDRSPSENQAGLRRQQQPFFILLLSFDLIKGSEASASCATNHSSAA
jgi:hypothetical protein